MTGRGDRPSGRVASGSDVARLDPSQVLAALAADGPDEMGRDLAGAPEVVEATLAEVRLLRSRLQPLFDSRADAVLIGTGMSLAVAQTAAPWWLLARRRAGHEPSLLIRESAAVALGSADGRIWQSGSLVVAVSKSGTSPETLAAARDAASAGCIVIAVTADQTSPLASVAALVVPTPIGDEGGASTRSATAALTALFMIPGGDAMGSAAQAALVGRLRATVGSWDLVAPVGLRLATAPQTWILGLGTGVGLAQAAGILWHEKVRREAVSLSVSEFRHGPVEAVRAGDAVVVVDADRNLPVRAAYLELLRSELEQLGAFVVWLSASPPPGVTGIRLLNDQPAAASGEPSPAMALEALVRLEQLARTTAHAAGTYIDGFAVLREIVKPAAGLVGAQAAL
jgi:fructoselysine-6-P-deglycase FrlB-like protein